MKRAPTGQSYEERFRYHMPGDPPDGGKDGPCWMWPLSATSSGYGMIRVRGVGLGAHVVSHVLFNGPVPEGYDVRHWCDVKLCVNPAHLELGTRLDNMRDMVSRDRSLRGERRPNARLTESDVLRIRKLVEDGSCQTTIAKDYGVALTTVNAIVKRRTWRHI